MGNIRENLNIVVVGHVDHGKSTLIGRLLYDTKALSEGAIEKVKKISKEKGKEFEYAYLLDAFEEEQKQGITIDTTRLQFATEKRDYVIIDAPGHKEFLKNMISGAASAEAALLMVDAHEGIQEQSRRHGYILSLLGIQKVYVVINKMDLVNYDEEIFNKIRSEFDVFLNKLNVYPQKYIPISAYFGENIAKNTEAMPWYEGESILGAIDLLDKDKGLEEKPLRLPIQDVYKFDHRRIIAGRIESGTIKVGDEILISPSNKVTKVKTIEYWAKRDKTDTAVAGMSVGITVEDEFFNKRGELISLKTEAPFTANVFDTNIFWMGKNDLVKGKKYKLKLTTQEVACEILHIHKVVDAVTLKSMGDAAVVKRNDVAEVTIKTEDAVAFDLFNHVQNTGRFVIVDDYDVSGGGIISEASNPSKIQQIIPKAVHGRLVTKKDRETKHQQKGKVIWLTGLPGCGKNEIAMNLEKKLFDMKKQVYYLSEDGLEKSQNDGQLRKTAEIANLFADSGTIAIVTSDSRTRKDREQVKKMIGKENYIEVFVNATQEVCAARNGKVEKDFYYEKSSGPVITVYIDHAEFKSDEKAQGIIELIEGQL